MDKQAKTRIVTGCVLAAVSLFAALSLFSWTISWWRFESLERQGTVLTEFNMPNWCGWVGNWFASTLAEIFGGPAAYFGLGLALFWSYMLLTSKARFSDAALRIFGSVVLVVSVSALTALAGNRQVFASWVGLAVSEFATGYFALAGSYLLLLLAAVLSLLLATDFLVVAPAGRALVAMASAARAGWVKFVVVQPWRAKTAPASSRVTVPDPSLPPVRTRKSPVIDPADAQAKTLPLPKFEPAKAESPKSAPAADVARAFAQAKPAEPPKPKVEAPEPPRPKVDVLEPVTAKLASSEPATAVLEPAPRAPRPARPALDKPVDGEGGYIFPPLSLLDDPSESDLTNEEQYIQDKARILEETLAEFGVSVKVVGIETGPVITQYELELAPGIKVNRVVSLSDDIAMALKAPSVRIVAPIPGRDSVGVEVPNTKKAIVRLKGLFVERPSDKAGILPTYLGRDAQGEPLVPDLTEMPHLLIAGATGAGKSVCINSVILSVLMRQHPDDVKLLLVDPKMVELSVYKDVPHLICPVVTDMKKASTILEWACMQMDSRYDVLAAVSVRHVSRYNKLGPKGIRERLGVPLDAQIELPDKLAYIIIIIDELADLMMVAAKDVETSITRLAQKSRAVGIHLVLATQRPSVDVITGLIKSNLPARLSFKVSSRIDSRTILDQNGADKLLGRGDMLFLPPATAKLIRAQGSFVSDEEIRRVVEFSKGKRKPSYDEELVGWQSGSSGAEYLPGMPGDLDSDRDPLYDQAVDVVVENQRGSVSLLQRRLEIGYSRAARLIDIMAENGILGPYKGSQAREVLFTPDQWEEMKKETGKRVH